MAWSVLDKKVKGISGNTIKDGTGTELRLVVDANGYLQVGVVDAAGNRMPAMDAVGRAGFVKITDGVNLTSVLAAGQDNLANTVNQLVTAACLMGYESVGGVWDRVHVNASGALMVYTP